TRDRKAMAQEQEGLGYCNITKCCTDVCPENIKITDNAIIPMKERVVDTKYDPVVFLGSKIGRRKTARTVVGPIPSSGSSPIKRPERVAADEGATAAAAAATSGGVLRKVGSALHGGEGAAPRKTVPAGAVLGATGVGVIAWVLRRRRKR